MFLHYLLKGCPPGKHLNAEQWKCINCSVNTYKTYFGNGQCTQCPTHAITRGQSGLTENKCSKYILYLTSIQFKTIVFYEIKMFS